MAVRGKKAGNAVMFAVALARVPRWTAVRRNNCGSTCNCMTMIRAASVSEWEGRLLHYSDGPEGLWMTLATREAVVAMVENGLYKLTDKLYSEEATKHGRWGETRRCR